uniref:Uncharacterized protein n=1 Tax=Brassica oleracea TaxID=3712 RepID=A0A3P6BV58_BRAOL|nr:unnamed protein product [Brassica oleracea]
MVVVVVSQCLLVTLPSPTGSIILWYTSLYLGVSTGLQSILVSTSLPLLLIRSFMVILALYSPLILLL